MQRDCPNQKRVLYSAQTAGYESISDDNEDVKEESVELEDVVIRPEDHDYPVAKYSLLGHRSPLLEEKVAHIATIPPPISPPHSDDIGPWLVVTVTA